MSEKDSDELRCLYLDFNGIPQLYPATPGAAATTVNGHANANEWGNWTVILDDATIEGTYGEYFDIQGFNITGITANSFLYFELRYNSITVGRGYVNPSGTAIAIVKYDAFKMIATKKVEGEDLEMRIMSDQAGESVDVKPVMWCSGTP